MPKKDKLKDVAKILAKVVKTGKLAVVAKEHKVHPTALRYHLRRDKKLLAAFRAQVKANKVEKKAVKKKAA